MNVKNSGNSQVMPSIHLCANKSEYQNRISPKMQGSSRAMFRASSMPR